MAVQHRDSSMYQKKLNQFLADLERVKKYDPPEVFLYPILDTPVFADVQTALDMARLNHQQSSRLKKPIKPIS